MPRAYIETTFSSNPGKRRWYLAISCGSNEAARSLGTAIASLPLSVRTVLTLRVPWWARAVAVASVLSLILAAQMMIHLRIQGALAQRLLQAVEQPARIKR